VSIKEAKVKADFEDVTEKIHGAKRGISEKGAHPFTCG
jgi:hypothetical protein